MSNLVIIDDVMMSSVHDTGTVTSDNLMKMAAVLLLKLVVFICILVVLIKGSIANPIFFNPMTH